jgi:hypothetical protein
VGVLPSELVEEIPRTLFSQATVPVIFNASALVGETGLSAKPSKGEKRVSKESFERTHHLRGGAGYRFPWVRKAKQKRG